MNANGNLKNMTKILHSKESLSHMQSCQNIMIMSLKADITLCRSKERDKHIFTLNTVVFLH